MTPVADESRKLERIAIGATGIRAAPLPLAESAIENVILLIGDGMGGSQILISRIHLLGLNGRLHLERLPVTGLVLTHSADKPVTKSDSAATAMATGAKTANGRIGTDGKGQPLRSLFEELSSRGWATGVVTTTRITDATPASFATHVEARAMQAEIARQLVESETDLLAGGGRDFFVPLGEGRGVRTDGRDLLAEAVARGVTVIGDAAAWKSAASLPLFAIFPFEPQNETPRSPTVGELAAKSIELLAASEKPFFLLVEDEEIDSASHERDLSRLAGAVDRFDRAVQLATDFAAADGRTLVLVTGDHSTGGPLIDNDSTANELAVAWEGKKHTGEAIPLFAYGPPAAASRFSGILDNTEIPHRIAAALGFDFPRATTKTPPASVEEQP